jgi:hypothetical protein
MPESAGSAGPPQEANDALRRDAETSALVALRQAVWEASQWRRTDQIEEYVGQVLAEIESDEP